MTKRNAFAMIVAVAVVALLTVSFVPHHHHGGFMCLSDEHFTENSCGDSCTHRHCDGDSGLCDGAEDCSESGDGHSEDRSNCIEDEAFITSRPESRSFSILPPPVQLFLAIFIAYLSDDNALDDTEHDFGDLPPCLYKSANIDGTFSLRAPPFHLS